MKIILFLFGTLIGIPVSYGIYGLLTFFIESLFGRKIFAFKYLIFSYTPSTGFHICHFSPVCEISMRKENDTEKQEAASAVIKLILYYIVCITVIFFTIKIYQYDILPSLLMELAAGIALWFCMDGFMRIFFMARFAVNQKNPININYKNIVKSMMKGVPFDEIEVPDLRTYNCKIDKAYLITYQHLFFMNRVWHGDKAGISYAAQFMEKGIDINYSITDTAYLQNFTDVYYDLLFYYSYFDIQDYRARKIFSIISPDLLKDNDSNGYRTLAYYTNYILGDSESAEKYIRKGLELIDKFPIISQREYEKMLLTKLSEEISG